MPTEAQSDASYQTGWGDGYAEGYACKLADATEPFKPQSLDVPEAVEKVAEHLLSRYGATFSDRSTAIGCARAMIRIAREVIP